MNTQRTAWYLDGLISWQALNRTERDWVVLNHPEAAPQGAWLDTMAQ